MKPWLTPTDPQCPACGKTFITMKKALKILPKGKTTDVACASCGFVVPFEIAS